MTATILQFPATQKQKPLHLDRKARYKVLLGLMFKSGLVGDFTNNKITEKQFQSKISEWSDTIELIGNEDLLNATPITPDMKKTIDQVYAEMTKAE